MTLTFPMFYSLCTKVRTHDNCRTGVILCSAKQDEIFIIGTQCIISPARNDNWEGR